jgi:hypothetical protein
LLSKDESLPELESSELLEKRDKESLVGLKPTAKEVVERVSACRLSGVKQQ